jgi:large subunit ribosomal protein L31e
MPNASKSNKAAAGKTGPQGRSAIEDVVAREYTIHMHKRVRSV